MTTPTGSVAFTASLPVDVLMKSAPAIMATWLARATFTRVARSPVPRITFMWASPQACRKARTSSYGLPRSGQRVRARDHHVDLLRPRGDRCLDLFDALGQGVQPRRESRRDRRHRDRGAL